MARETGSTVERVLAIVAVVIAATALVVAVARKPGSSRASPPTATTSTLAPVVGRKFGAFGVNRKTCLATYVLAGDTHIPIDHVGSYVWTSRYVRLPQPVLGKLGVPEGFESSQRVEGSAELSNAPRERQVTRGKALYAWRITFTVNAYSGKPNLHFLGAVAKGYGGCATTTTTR